MQRTGMAGGTGGAGDARLIKQDEHPCGIHFGQAEGAGGVQTMRRTAMNVHVRQSSVNEVFETIAQGFDPGLVAV